MEEHVSQMLERDEIRDVPALAGSLDAIYQHAIAIRNEVKSPTALGASTSTVERPSLAPKTKPKKAAPKATKKPVSAAPPPIKVQPPKKKKAQEKLQPTGELPSVGRRNLVHPLQAKATVAEQPAARQTVQSPSQPANQYRDRIALAMSQISTFDDDHERDEDRLAARNS